MLNESIPGGAFKGTDGRWHDANGNELSDAQVSAIQSLQASQAAAVKQQDKANASQSKDPIAQLLALFQGQQNTNAAPLSQWPQIVAAGYDTLDKVSAASDEDLLATGIDAAALEDIREVAPKKSRKTSTR